MTDIPSAFWRSKPSHEPCIMAFERIVRDFDLRLTWPNRRLAPWHVQAVVGADDPNPQTINFWPHLLKAHVPAQNGSVTGESEVRAMVTRAISDASVRPSQLVYVDCPTCNGSGEILILMDGADYGDPNAIYDEEDCPDCNGTGEVEDWEEDDA